MEFYERLRDELLEFVDTLMSKGIIGRQYYPSKENPDAVTIGFEEVLATRLNVEAEWQDNGALHVLQRLPAFRRIESTGQVVPFNGLGGVYGRQRDRGALAPP
ncbi:hypothetical protein BDW74DRAFT_179124 [Aspergillus multicolor]|uniref:uncharacterized protein n=1 Tax=Aspergillus multicolor TaxID=41759 RepID=UPI003CCD711F